MRTHVVQVCQAEILISRAPAERLRNVCRRMASRWSFVQPSGDDHPPNDVSEAALFDWGG
jgi:hypothetical protein